MFLTTTIYVPANSTISFPGLGLTLNPAVRVFPNSTLPIIGNIHWYGLLIGIGFLLAVIYCDVRCKKFGITEDQLINMLLCAVPSAVICARAYYCIFYWDLFRDDPISCLYIWQGGLAIYGAVIGAVAAAILYCKAAKISVGAMLDLGGLGLPIGQCLGRWGNFVNREAFGAPTDSFLRMGLVDIAGKLDYYHPTFFYESMWNLVGFVLLHFLSKKRRFDGEVFTLYVAWYGLGRAWIEGLRTDSLMLFGTGIRVSQLLAGVSCLAAVTILLYVLLRKKPQPENLYVNRISGKKKEL